MFKEDFRFFLILVLSWQNFVWFIYLIFVCVARFYPEAKLWSSVKELEEIHFKGIVVVELNLYSYCIRFLLGYGNTLSCDHVVSGTGGRFSDTLILNHNKHLLQPSPHVLTQSGFALLTRQFILFVLSSIFAAVLFSTAFWSGSQCHTAISGMSETTEKTPASTAPADSDDALMDLWPLAH